MQPIMRHSAAPRPHRSALGFLIAPLVAGRTSAEGVFKRYFGGTELGRVLYRAIRHGSLVDGRIKRAEGGEPPSVARPFRRRVARRMLAAYLMLAEGIDPTTGAGSGRHLWQGGHARRLGLSVRELQRYLRLFEAAGAIARHQPNAEHVPDWMKGRPKPSALKGGRVLLCQWAYNKISTLPGRALPHPIRRVLRRWRGIPERVAPTAQLPPVEVPRELGELAGPAAALAWLRSRAPA